MRYVLISLAILIAGCEQNSTNYDPLDSEIACLAARAIVASTKNAPPQPPEGICDNCGGKGKVGDGVVMVVCPVCKGSGKR